LAFFFGFVDVDLLPLVDLNLFVVAALDPFRAPFVAGLDPFVAAVALTPIVAADLELFALLLASCAARIAKSSCLLEHPVFSKIRLMVGEVSSSSMVAREEALVNVREGRMS